MNRVELLADIRQKVGAPGRNEVADEVLEPYAIGALEWLCGELRYEIRTEPAAIALAEDQRDYPIPADVVEVLSVEWDERRLTPSSTSQWDRQGAAWQTVTAGTPAEYAIESRRLILMPPPGEDALEEDSFVRLRYVAAPGALAAGGPSALPPLDHRLCAYEAAYRYLIERPTETNIAMADRYLAQIARLLPGARRRAQNAVRELGLSFRVRSYREGAAR